MNATKTTLNGKPAIIYTPVGYDPAKTYPLVVFLHGMGEMGDGTQGASGLDKLLNSANHANLLKAGDTYGFVVLAPQFVQSLNNWAPGWAGGSYIDGVVEAFKSSTSIKVDANRTYLTGLSMGGGGCWESILINATFAAKYAAVIPICPTCPSSTANTNIAKTLGVQVWAFHAQNDPTCPIGCTSGTVSNIGPTAKITVYPTGGHSIWGTVYNDQSIYTWMLSKSLGGTVIPPTPTPTGTTKTVIARHYKNTSTLTVYDDLTTSLL